MRKLTVTTLMLVLLPLPAAAADLGVSGTTLVRIEERRTPGFSSQTLVPATQYLDIDARNMADGNLSLHLDAWGRGDLGDKSTGKGKTDGDLSSAYLRYVFPLANAEVKAGRFKVFDSGVIEAINGVSARADLLPAYEGMALSLFSGTPVKLDRSNDNKGDYIAGGRLSYSYKGLLELGGSMVHEGGMDRNGPNTNVKDYRQTVGGDIWLTPHSMVSLTGRSYYNTATSGFAENSYLLNIKPIPPLTVSLLFNQYNFRDYFSASNLRSLFNPDTNESYTDYGTRITYLLNKQVEMTVDFKHYQRDSKGDSSKFGGECRLALLDNRLRSGFSWHRLAGSGNINSYHEIRAYALYNTASYSASIDAITQRYDSAIDTRRSAFETIASLGYRIMPELALSGDLSYGSNPRMTEEVKALLRLSFNYSVTSKGAGK
jgi:hypothetical protein